MRWYEAVTHGVVQGLTEFLPVSSTAHLRVVPALLGWDDPGAAFTAAIQLGTLVAVGLYFRRDLGALLAGVVRTARTGEATPEARLALLIALGTVPIVACGLVFKDRIETDLRSLWVVAAALIGVGLVMAVAERAGRRDRPVALLSLGRVALIGLAQALALIPGVSRSGATIAAGLFAGLDREAAARFSFLLSLPSVFAAGAYQLVRARRELFASGAEAFNLATAAAVAGVVGYLSISLLLRFLTRYGLTLFVAYRLLLGGAIAGLLLAGKLAP